MTVKRDAANESSRLRNAIAGKKLSERESDRVFCTKLEACKADRGSAGSSEDMHSPRSVVAKVRKWPAMAVNKNVNLNVHSQILRIREEDSHIGEDMAENFSTVEAMDKSNSKLASDDDHRYHHVDVLIFSHRPILPASPLSGKTYGHQVDNSSEFQEKDIKRLDEVGSLSVMFLHGS